MVGTLKRYAGLLFFVGLVLTPVGSLADASGDVDATLEAFHTAASEADLDTYLGLMTPEMVFLGTDGTERWQGQAWRDFVSAAALASWCSVKMAGSLPSTT